MENSWILAEVYKIREKARIQRRPKQVAKLSDIPC